MEDYLKYLLAAAFGGGLWKLVTIIYEWRTKRAQTKATELETVKKEVEILAFMESELKRLHREAEEDRRRIEEISEESRKQIREITERALKKHDEFDREKNALWQRLKNKRDANLILLAEIDARTHNR